MQAQGHDLRQWLPKQAHEPHLSRGSAQDLRQRRRWNGDGQLALPRPFQQGDDSAIPAVQADQRAGVEDEPLATVIA